MGEPPPRQPFSHVKFHLLPPKPPATKKKKTKTTHLGKPGSKNILSEYSFLNTRLVPTKNNKERSGGGKPIRAADLLCVSLLVALLWHNLIGCIVAVVGAFLTCTWYLPYLNKSLEAWRDGLNERKIGEWLSIIDNEKKK